MKFCNQCGATVSFQVPVDDDRERHVCSACETIHYINPKVVVGCLPTVGDRILLCKRAIEPRFGMWTLPAGFMENGETSAEGAARETWEEAAAKAIDLALYRIFDVPYINQVYLFYRCHHITFWQGVVSNRRKRRPLHTHARLRYCLPRGDGFFGDINNMRPTRVIEVCQAIRILWHIANSNIPVR